MAERAPVVPCRRCTAGDGWGLLAFAPRGLGKIASPAHPNTNATTTIITTVTKITAWMMSPIWKPSYGAMNREALHQFPLSRFLVRLACNHHHALAGGNFDSLPSERVATLTS